jgi:hypothetical protein
MLKRRNERSIGPGPQSVRARTRGRPAPAAWARAAEACRSDADEDGASPGWSGSAPGSGRRSRDDDRCAGTVGPCACGRADRRDQQRRAMSNLEPTALGAEPVLGSVRSGTSAGPRSTGWGHHTTLSSRTDLIRWRHGPRWHKPACGDEAGMTNEGDVRATTAGPASRREAAAVERSPPGPGLSEATAIDKTSRCMSIEQRSYEQGVQDDPGAGRISGGEPGVGSAGWRSFGPLPLRKASSVRGMSTPRAFRGGQLAREGRGFDDQLARIPGEVQDPVPVHPASAHRGINGPGTRRAVRGINSAEAPTPGLRAMWGSGHPRGRMHRVTARDPGQPPGPGRGGSPGGPT